MTETQPLLASREFPGGHTTQLCPHNNPYRKRTIPQSHSLNLKSMERNKLVNPFQADGKHCVHDVLFLTFI